MSSLYKAAFHTVRLGGKLLGRSSITRGLWNRIYEPLGRKAYPSPERFVCFRNRWGHELKLSYSYHIDRQILGYGTYDEALQSALEYLVKPGMVCMDVGAHIGEMALHMGSKVKPRGTVYAFEPVPHIHKRLIHHIEDNELQETVKPFEIALSNTNGTVKIAFMGEDADNQAVGSIVNTSRKELTRHLDIKSQTLDSFVEEHGINALHLMKIDIEGGEWFLLEGGRQAFSRLSPTLLMEFSSDLRDIGRDSAQLAQLIESFGYSIFSVSPKGKPDRRLHAKSIAPEFTAANVYCAK